MEKKSPKAFWDTLREIEAADQDDCDSNNVISPMEWLSHFKTLMFKNREKFANSDISVTTDDYTGGSLLDFAITEKGVIVCVF